MTRRNRSYKRGEPFRDARLFIIACEGQKREPAYFHTLCKRNLRVKLLILKPADGESAPRWVLRRAREYLKSFGLQRDDQLWLVLDRDRWKMEHLKEIARFCKAQNRNLALSNPCFELWLLLHKENLPKSPPRKCNDLKRRLHTLKTTNEKLCREVRQAIANARDRDSNPDGWMPGEMETKVYLLAQELINLGGS
ncbi:MAG: RloB domain-containing protein [Bacteroidetes bacterium]|nr:MAG: RloB domain-containing protein [Bacteroidota bacterium]